MHHDPELLRLFGEDIRRQGAVVAEQVPLLRQAAEAVAGDLPPRPERVYLIGCGDSLDGAMASRPVWERLLPDSVVEAVPAMTFSSYAVDSAPPGSLVVALSQSGKVTRVIEGVRAARARGMVTLAVTARADSPLAAEPVDHLMVVPFPKLGRFPGQHPSPWVRSLSAKWRAPLCRGTAPMNSGLPLTRRRCRSTTR